MTAKTRLARIEKRLTPQEVVVAYVDEIMRRFDSYSEWAEWVADRPSEAPLIRVCRATTDAVRNTMRGQPRDAVNKAVDRAVREAIFLGKLFLSVTQKLLEEVEPYRLRAVFCARSLQVLLLTNAVGGEAVGVAGTPDAEPRPNRTARLRDQLHRHLGEVRLHQMVIEAIGRSYIAGRAILFPEHARLLASVVQTAEVLAEEYNGFARAWVGDSQEDPLIDLEEIDRLAAEAVRGEVAYAVRMTKAETLVALGMNDEGFQMAVEAYRGREPRCFAPASRHDLPPT